MLLTLAPLVSVLAASGCFSLGTWPLDNDVTGIFQSTQECWRYTKGGLLQYMTTGVFANSPPSLENWHVRPAPCDTPLTVDICCLNAQVLRDTTDEGETVWGLLDPTLRVAHHLTALEINSHVTAQRSGGLQN